MQYVLPLMPADNSSTRRMTTLHLMLAFALCGIGAGCIVLYWFTAVSPKFTAAYGPFALLGACCFIVGLGIAAIAMFNKSWLMKGKRSAWLRVAEMLLIGTVALAFALSGQIRPAVLFGMIGIAVLAATLWELRKPASHEAVISDAGVMIPKKGSSQLLRWSEIENVLLRHGILSIELTGNKLVQRSIRPDADFDAATIETFCQTYIRKFEKERAANADW